MTPESEPGISFERSALQVPEQREKTGPAKYKVIQVVLFAGMLQWLVSMAVTFIFGSARHLHEALHECVELTGTCIALAVAMLLWLRCRQDEESSHLLWAAAALVAMGLLDGAHAVVPFGVAWSWLHHGATVVGGLLFAMVWLPMPGVVVRRRRFLMPLVGVFAVAGSLAIWWRPDLMPAPWEAGGYSFTAKAANVVGGIAFLAAACFFLRRYLRRPQTEDLVFASQTLLFGTASLLFGFSHVWAADWWVWHGFRLVAYAIVLIAAYEVVATLYQEIAGHAQKLEARVRERTAELRCLASIVTSSNDAIFSKTLEGVVTSWNPGAEAIYGYSAEEMIGQSIAISVPNDRRDDFTAIIEKVSRGERVEHYETTRLRKDGRTIHVSLSISPVRDEVGGVVGASTIARDITERKRTEEKLHQASLYARSLIEASLDPLVTISKDGKVMDVNRATEMATGVDRKKLIGSDFCDYFTEPEKAREGYERVFAKGAVRDYPLALRDSSGRLMHVLYNATLFENGVGQVEGIFAAARDVTKQKQAEQALRASEQRIRLLLDSTAEAIYGEDLEGTCTFCNNATARLLGYEHPSELIGKNMHALMHHSRADSVPLSIEDCSLTKAVRAGRDYHSEELVFWRTNGTCFPVECWSHTLLEDGKPNGAVVTFLDISERKRAEQEIRELNQQLEERVQQRTEQLQQSERRVRRKLESILSPSGDLASLELSDLLDIPAVQSLADEVYKLAQIPMFILDRKGKVLVSVGWQQVCTKFHRAHPEACRNCEESDRELSTGVAPGKFKLYRCKNNLWDVVTPIMLGEQQVGNLFSGQFFFADEIFDQTLFQSQAREYGFDEQEYLAALARVPRLRRTEVETGMKFYSSLAQLLSQLSYSGIQLARSMTEAGRANADLAATVKELEAFTYSVSHDLRAPLRHISGFSKILSEEFGPNLPPDAQHHLRRIAEGTGRMGLLVDDLLNLARVGRRDLSVRASGLKSIVDEVLAELAPDCTDRNISWNVANLPFAECDPGLMKQVFHNLLSNAVKFTRPRSQAVIEVGQKEQDGTPVVFVRDNGVGFSMKYADKLFGVFQRLHRAEDFEGTGVGLATVQRIIQKHGGRIWAEAELDQGATFYFTLGTCEKTETKTKAAMAGDHT